MSFRFKRSKISIVLILPVALILVLISGWSGSDFEVGPDEANARIHQKFEIPPSARNVSYESNPRATRVTFTIARKDFEEWMRKKEFRTRPVTPEWPASRFIFVAPGKYVFDILKEGIAFDSEGTCGISGSFGFEDGLCSAVFSCK